MKGRMKWFWAVIIVYIFFTLPLLIANVLSVDWFGFAPGKADAWIGFWGSYLGGVFSSGVVIFTTWKIVGTERKNFKDELDLRERERKVGVFFRKTSEVLERMNKLKKESLNTVYAYRDILHESELIGEGNYKICTNEVRKLEKSYEKSLNAYLTEEALFFILLRNLLQLFPSAELFRCREEIKRILDDFYRTASCSKEELLIMWRGIDSKHRVGKEEALEKITGELHDVLRGLFQVISSMEEHLEKIPTSQLEDDER